MENIKKISVLLFAAILFFSLTGSGFVYAHEGKGFHDEYDQLDDQTKQKVDGILTSLRNDLNDMGLKIGKHGDKHDSYNKLDEDKKAKVKEIIKQLEEKKITKEEADKQLEALGISKKDKHCKALEGIDGEKRKEAEKIFAEMKEGKITKEEATEKLQKIGIEMPKHPMIEKFEKLDEETKEKIVKRIEEAKKEFEEIGVSFPKKYEYLIK